MLEDGLKSHMVLEHTEHLKMVRVFAVNGSVQDKPPLAMLLMICNRCSIRCESSRVIHGAE